jgi:hypothetical protein
VSSISRTKNPKEVARWQSDNPFAGTIRTKEGEQVAGRYLHDLQVKDGLAYLAYWQDGLIILDVGAGLKGGSPEHAQFVSQLRFNHHDLYGDGWLAGTHSPTAKELRLYWRGGLPFLLQPEFENAHSGARHRSRY